MQGFRLRHILQLFLLLVACLLVACSSQPAILKMVSDIPQMVFDIPPPGQEPDNAPVVRRPRRVPFVDPSIEEMKKLIALMEERAKAPPPTNWAELYKKLPKDDDDNIDWMAALKDKMINPQPGVDPKTPNVEPDEDDEPIELHTSGKPAKFVMFSHTPHVMWLNCNNCHPAIFKKDAGSTKITMDDIDAGKYCGVCHDKVAIAQPSGCKGCHKVKSVPDKKKPA